MKRDEVSEERMKREQKRNEDRSKREDEIWFDRRLKIAVALGDTTTLETMMQDVDRIRHDKDLHFDRRLKMAITMDDKAALGKLQNELNSSMGL
jgi:hypothetical protein